MDIKNKVALITGGASGLGFASAQKLIAAGAKIMVMDLNEDNAKKACSELDGETDYAVANVAEEASVQEAINKTMDKFGKIDIVLNCAGIGSASKTVGKDGAHPLDYFKIVLDVNLVGTFNVLRLAAVEMGKNEPEKDNECGVIINTASVAAYDGQIGQAAYSASKGAVVAMTLPIARELARHAIRIMVIAPGIMETPMLKGLPQNVQDALGQMVPYPSRLGRPEEFARLVAHIAENSYLNGEVIRLDGAIRMAAK